MSFLRDLASLLRLRDFRLVFGVRLISQFSDGAFQVALATYVVFSPERQTSPEAIASAMAVLLLPYSLLGPFTGVLLDRWRRRQALLYGNLLRATLASVTAVLVLARLPDWLFYASALSVTAVNRFVLAGLSAALPRVVPPSMLVMANAVSPTAGTVAATLGGGSAFVVHAFMARGPGSDSVVVLIAAALYLAAAVTARKIPVALLGPEVNQLQPRFLVAVTSTVRGLMKGLGHVAERRPAAYALAAMAAMRFCYGALTVTVLMLCRYAFVGSQGPAAPGGATDTTAESGGAIGGMTILGLAVACSGAGFLVAALITPWATRRTGVAGWITVCAGVAAVFEPALGLPFLPIPVLGAAFLLGLVTQGAKIATDTIVQGETDDRFRGRVFAIYDVLFNVAFVAAAAVTAVVLPPDGRSSALLLSVAFCYGLIALSYGFMARRHPPRSVFVGQTRQL